MRSCAFFGHRAYNYEADRDKIKNAISELIEGEGVGEFYSGYRGNFERLCAEIVHELKPKFSWINSVMVLSYHPKKDFSLSPVFDSSVYLLERSVPPPYVILETNKLLVDHVDIILSRTIYDFGGAAKAVEYAEKHNKTIISLKT